MSEIQYSVEVKDVEKHFKVYMDKGSTLKERAIFHNRNRHENRQILDGISFEIPKGQAVGLNWVRDFTRICPAGKTFISTRLFSV